MFSSVILIASQYSLIWLSLAFWRPAQVIRRWADVDLHWLVTKQRIELTYPSVCSHAHVLPHLFVLQINICFNFKLCPAIEIADWTGQGDYLELI